jgi:hypothetical protein
LVTWAEEEYNQRPHSTLGGRKPLDVWNGDADEIQWVEDYSALEALFVGEVTRKALNDSTLSYRGTIYEVPTHLRGMKVTVRYSLLNPERIWVMDGDVEVPIRPVDPEANAQRTRKVASSPETPKPATGLNAAELLLDRVLGRKHTENDTTTDKEGETCEVS